MSEIRNLMTKQTTIPMESNTVYLLAGDTHELYLPEAPEFGDLIGMQALGETTYFKLLGRTGASMRFLDHIGDASDVIIGLSTTGCGQNVYLTYSPDGFWMVSSCMGNFALTFDDTPNKE